MDFELVNVHQTFDKWILNLSAYINKVTKKTVIFTKKTSIFKNAIYNLLMYDLGLQNAIDNLLMHDPRLRNRLQKYCVVQTEICITSCVSSTTPSNAHWDKPR